MGKKKMVDSKLDEQLEQKLDGIFNPVSPNKSYIENLQKKLISDTEVSVEYPNLLIPTLVIVGGLVFGSFLIVVINRIVWLIFGKSKED